MTEARPVDVPPVVAKHFPFKTGEGTCQWFANCKKEATHTHSHPTLGEVPICDRCESWYERNSR